VQKHSRETEASVVAAWTSNSTMIVAAMDSQPFVYL
jgi:hypothetical protein